MGTPLRPMPEDFAEYASKHPRRQVEQHYKCGNVSADRWYLESGVKTPRANLAKIPKTANADIKRMVSEGKKAEEVGAVYGVSRKVVAAYVARHNLGPWCISRDRVLPSDFVATASGLTRLEAKQKWGCSNDTLSRWYKETGLTARARKTTLIKAPDDLRDRVGGMNIKDASSKLGINRAAAARIMREAGLWDGRTVAAPKPAPEPTDNRWKFRKPAGGPPMPVNFYTRDMSPTGLAKDCLQRDRWTVFRCDLHGHPMADGLFWKCGNAICTDGELLDRADRAARRMGEVVTWRGRLDTEMAA